MSVLKEVGVSNPKVRVETVPGIPGGKIIDFDEAKKLPFSQEVMFLQGYRVGSYEEFLEMASQEKYQNSEVLDVLIMTDVPDGG